MPFEYILYPLSKNGCQGKEKVKGSQCGTSDLLKTRKVKKDKIKNNTNYGTGCSDDPEGLSSEIVLKVVSIHREDLNPPFESL